MSCLVCDPSNIYMYAAVCGLFTGAACSRLIRNILYTKPGKNEKGISALVPIYLSIAILSALGGFFFGGRNPEPVILIPFGIIAGAALLTGLFRRAAGIPVFIVSAALLLSLGFTLRNWYCVPEEGELINLTLVSSGDGGVRLQASISGEPALFIESDYETIVLRTELLRVHPAWFFIRRGRFIKPFVGGAVSETVQSGKIEKLMYSLPGIELLTHVTEEFKPVRFRDYTLFYDEMSGFELVTDDS